MNTPKYTKTEHIGTYSRSVTYAVHGFWSGDSVRVTQERDIHSMEARETLKWEAPRVIWSTGGADHTAEPDRLLAASCFAEAILDAVQQGRVWESMD